METSKETSQTGGELVVNTQGEEGGAIQRPISRLPLGRRPSANMLQRAEKVGLTGPDEKRAVELILLFGSNFQSMVRWREDGMTLGEIGYYLEFREFYGFSMSIPLIRKFAEGAGFRLPDLTDRENAFAEYGAKGSEAVIELFTDICDRIGGSYPEHRVMHFIEERFGGDVMVAYQLAVNDSDAFIALIDPGYFGPSEPYEEDRDILERLSTGQVGGRTDYAE
jgi:hypothetical protein